MDAVRQDIARARQIVAQPKQWAGPDAVPWRAALAKRKGFEFTAALTIDATQPEGLFVKGYFKADGIGRVRDKLSLSLVHGARLVGLDEGGMRHANIILAPKLSLPVIQRPLL